MPEGSGVACRRQSDKAIGSKLEFEPSNLQALILLLEREDDGFFLVIRICSG
jgi:hypothetical protein